MLGSVFSPFYAKARAASRAVDPLDHCALNVALYTPRGKLWSLVDKAADREIFWHNPRMAPRLAPYGATYDDWFCGGWDELFPNDAPTSFAGASVQNTG